MVDVALALQGYPRSSFLCPTRCASQNLRSVPLVRSRYGCAQPDDRHVLMRCHPSASTRRAKPNNALSDSTAAGDASSWRGRMSQALLSASRSKRSRKDASPALSDRIAARSSGNSASTLRSSSESRARWVAARRLWNADMSGIFRTRATPITSGLGRPSTGRYLRSAASQRRGRRCSDRAACAGRPPPVPSQ